MRYSKLIDSLQNLIDFKPTYKQLGEILGVGGSAIGNRAARDADFSDDEIIKIEKQYGIVLKETPLPTDIINVDYYPDVFASCGGGSFDIAESTEKMLLSKHLISGYSISKNYFVINAVGESMQPFIFDKDRLIVEQYANEPIFDNRIYVFCYDDKIFIKRLVQNINQVTVISDNPDKTLYPTQSIINEQLETFKIIGQIVGVVRDVR